MFEISGRGWGLLTSSVLKFVPAPVASWEVEHMQHLPALQGQSFWQWPRWKKAVSSS